MVITYKAGNRLVGENKLYYKVHTFTSSGTFEITAGTGDVEYLVIAGGAGGGGSVNNTVGSAGGGAGGYRTATLSRGLGSYTVTVGAGGAGGGTSGANGTDGSDSVFDTITSDGGGGGGGSSGFTGSGEVGNTGGSGGGSGRLQSGAAGTSGQGYAGGDGTTGAYYAGGGGGGSAAVGSNAVSSAPGYGSGGAGGAGTSSSITGTAVIRAGGGGGGGHYAGGAGGSGGGGAGTNNYSGDDGLPATANTGSGGGGCSYNGNNSGGAGGSGIVIVKYHSSDINATGGTVTEIDDGSAAKPTADGTLVNNSTFTETDTGKEYILDYGTWREKNKPADCMGELLDDHSNVRKTHSWWWFSGQNIEPGWAFWAGTGGVRISYGMEDAVDGGYQIIMTNGHIGTMDAENTRQYNHNGAVMLGVCKRASTNGKFGLGFVANRTVSDSGGGVGYMDRGVTRLLIRNSTNNIQGTTSNGSGATYHDTGITSDNKWRLLKIEMTAGATHFSVDGVLKVSSSGSENETDAKVQPMFMAWGDGASGGGNIRYMEVFNT